MKRLIASLILVAAMAGTAAADVFVFETVDEFERREQELHFSGLPQGEAEATDLSIRWNGEPPAEAATCERMALMAMARPGRYLLRVTTQWDDVYDLHYIRNCRLIRR